MNMLDVSHVRVFPTGRFGVSLCLPAVFFFAGFAHSATIVDNTTLDIDSSAASTDYLVRNNGVLNASGANTRSITAQSGSLLNLNGATIVGNNGGDGVTVTSSQATIDQTTVTSDEIGLAVNRSSVAAGGSKVTVSNSQVSAQLIGSQVTGLSSLSLSNTQIMGAASDGIGVNILGGEVSASARTTITGQATGVRMVNDAANVGGPTLSLDNSTVQGVSGSAILVDRGTQATIVVSNGSSVLAGNGRLLDVQGSSTASMTVADSTLNGNISVADNSTANLVFDQGRITGDVLVDGSSTATVTLDNLSQFTGRLDNVDSVNVNSNSNWTLTGNDSIGALGMNGGTVTFGAQDAPGTYYTLNVGSLSGNGTFAMKGDFASGEHDFLNVIGASAGDFALAVAASGLDAASPQALTLVRTGTLDGANFALAGDQRVDVGTWSYSLASREIEGGAKEWFLDPTTEVISPGARSVLALFNTAPTVWYGELSSLRSRMGELRFNGGQAGGWIRTYGNKYNVADGSGVGYQQTQQGLSLGADARLGESQVLVGVLAGTSESDLDLNRGTSGTVKSYYVGPYLTWLDSDTGYYFDGVLKFNRFRNESKVNLSDGSRTKGDYDNWGVGGSAEFGRHIKLANDYFVEPFAQLSAVQIQGKHYTLDNDMDADGDRMRSLLGKAGATFGRNFGFGNGAVAQPYVRAAVAHEFASNNEVKVNNNVFNNDLSGSRAEFGAGVAVAMSERWQVHADLDYAKGEHIEQPYGVNLGLRYFW
ncbi:MULTISPECIES: autotransporter outer membrane beta-barrel domain-containing protein [unclassified Pseudomonas]|uniref:autotransporter outer membrane beta-barrel domain-containing protein n=1 Tax=unclassified Pseudomonas TaxID=196821 RepID=UPI0002723F71|nr:outer membrane autotransporter barrel domain-containing protein [Pseudomonas sp. GM16]EJM27232.1 outer membrane autotransporter barrel domain-containing protein [Pseudomonas sp. GM24]